MNDTQIALYIYMFVFGWAAAGAWWGGLVMLGFALSLVVAGKFLH